MMLARGAGRASAAAGPGAAAGFFEVECLRNYQREEESMLENILADLIRRHWAGSAGAEITPQHIIDCVQNDGALIIFDGLDEKIIPLSEGRRVAFFRELWRVLPPAVMDRPGGIGARGKLIVSCRSHYFPTVVAQNEAFAGGRRDGVRATDYAACVMLPWREEQIDLYLGKVLGEERVPASQGDHRLRPQPLRPRPAPVSALAHRPASGGAGAEARRRGESQRGQPLHPVHRTVARPRRRQTHLHPGAQGRHDGGVAACGRKTKTRAAVEKGRRMAGWLSRRAVGHRRALRAGSGVRRDAQPRTSAPPPSSSAPIRRWTASASPTPRC
ncbi:MAG: hypothetical protein R3F11_22250 [Verrucomicrobiales bacterium]